MRDEDTNHFTTQIACWCYKWLQVLMFEWGTIGGVQFMQAMDPAIVIAPN